MQSFSEKARRLPAELFVSDTVNLRPIETEDDLWYAVAECKLTEEQAELVNPAGFSIGRAWLNPANNLPCVILRADGTPVGFISLLKWRGPGEGLSWSYYIDTRYQGQGLGRAAADLAIQILRAVDPHMPIKLSTEAANQRAQRLYRSLGFALSDELDGDDLVFVL